MTIIECIMSKEQAESAYHLVVHYKVLRSSRPSFSHIWNISVITVIGSAVKNWVNELNLIERMSRIIGTASSIIVLWFTWKGKKR